MRGDSFDLAVLGTLSRGKCCGVVKESTLFNINGAVEMTATLWN